MLLLGDRIFCSDIICYVLKNMFLQVNSMFLFGNDMVLLEGTMFPSVNDTSLFRDNMFLFGNDMVESVIIKSICYCTYVVACLPQGAVQS